MSTVHANGGHKPPFRFNLGQIVATPTALAALLAANQLPHELLLRHALGDWGDLTPDDVAANEDALRDGLRLFSAYTLADGTRVWIITEHDRSVTTILLPQDY